MVLIDVVKFDGADNEFVWKFPSQDLRLGTQLVVRTAQSAFFVKSGKIYDQFDPGTVTLKSGNIPLLNKLINIPFGGDSPFQAEVWFVNLISKLDNKWGTMTPIQIEDQEYHVVVPVRAYGQFGMKINNPRLFLETIVGTVKLFTANKIVEYFAGKLLAVVTSRITKKLLLEKTSVLQVGMFLEDLSRFCQEGIQEEFARFGVEVVNFYIMSINIPEDDPSVVKLKEAKELAMKIKTVGKDVYQMERSFNVMEKAAGNEGTAGGMIGAGMGLGIGVGVGGALGGQASGIANMVNTNPQSDPGSNQPPPLPTSVSYFVAIDGVQNGPFTIDQIRAMIAQGQITSDSLVWKSGMPHWQKAIEQTDIRNLFSITPPPLPKT